MVVEMKIRQLVLLRGIHPFYVDMGFQDFCMALLKWTILDIEEDDIAVDLIVTYESSNVTIGFSKERKRPITFTDLVSIETDDAILPDGRALTEIDIREFEEIFSCKLTRDEIPDRQIDGMGHWSCEGDLASMLVFEYEGLVTGIGIYRDPVSDT